MNIKISILILFLFASCASSKKSYSSVQQTDSLRQTSRLSIQSMRVPESRAHLIVPSAKLKELPSGAAFVQKSGQATAEIRFLHDTLFVTASCDSLQSLVYQYEEELANVSASTKVSEKEQARNKSGIIFGVMIAIVVFIALKIIFK